MKTLKPLTIESVPDNARASMAFVKKRLGSISNLMATLGNSPAMLNGYLALDAAWETTVLTVRERQLVLLTASVENKCLYCIAAHSTTLAGMRVDAEIIQSVRNRTALTHSGLDALVGLTRELVNERGFVGEAAKQKFFAAGYDEIVLMEILIGVALKTMSNYLDHLNPISIDTVFQEQAQAR